MAVQLSFCFFLLSFCVCVFAFGDKSDEGSNNIIVDRSGSGSSGSSSGNSSSRADVVTLDILDGRLRRIEEMLRRHAESTSAALASIAEALDARLPKCSPKNPCLYGGKCTEKPGTGDFSCSCPARFGGKRCERCLEGFVGEGRCVPDPTLFSGRC